MSAVHSSTVTTICIGLAWLGASIATTMTASAQADYFATPLPMNNRSPLSLLFISPIAPDPTLKPGVHQFSSLLDVSSHSLIEVVDDAQLELDGETLRLSLRWQFRPTARWQLGVELPWIAHSGGVFDNVIDNWHELTGLPDGERDRQPTDRLFFGFSNNDRSLDFRARRQGLGDVLVSSAYALSESSIEGRQSGWQHSSWLQLGVKLPTGSVDRLTGSDATDFAVSFHHHREQRADRPWALSFDAYAIRAGQNDLVEPVERTQWQINVKAALRWNATIIPEAQIRYRSANYQSPVPALGGTSLGLDTGVVWLRPNGAWRFGISEDIDVDSNPDVSFYVQYTRR